MVFREITRQVIQMTTWDLTLNNLQWLTFHKTQQINHYHYHYSFIYSLRIFHTSSDGFPRSLSDSKSHLVSRTFLSIMTDFTSVVILMVLILPQISTSSSLFFRFLEIEELRVRLILLSLSYSFAFAVLWQGPGICSVFSLF